MVQTFTLQTDIQPDRKLDILLPQDVPIGPAEVVVVIASHQPARPISGSTAADMAASKLFGLWADRTDVGDSLDYARKLRAQAEHRQDARA